MKPLLLAAYHALLRRVLSFLDRAVHSLSPRRLLWLGDVLGLAFYHLVPKKTRIARVNLDLAYRGKVRGAARDVLIRKVFRNLGRGFAEVARVDLLTPADCRAMLRPEHRARLDGALARGRGLLVLTAHFGNWGLLSAAFAAAGYRVNVLTKPVNDPVLNDFWRSRLTATGLRLLTRDDAMKNMAAALGRNEAVALVLDQNRPRDQGVFVDFFGRSASTISALAVLAMATKAPVVPVFLVRDEREPWRHRIEVLEPVPFVFPADGSDAVTRNTQAYTDVIESMVRRHPDQWIWIHRRWRSRPEGEEEFYPV